MSPRKSDVEVMYGTLDLMILKTLSCGPRHGLAILRWINEVTGNRLVIEEATLYPALHRMERKGWLDAEWGVSDEGRQAKFYSLTKARRSTLQTQVSRWSEYTHIVDPAGADGMMKERNCAREERSGWSGLFAALGIPVRGLVPR